MPLKIRRLETIVLLALCAQGIAVAQAPPATAPPAPPASCSVCTQAASGLKVVVIDARSGALDGRRRFAKRDMVQVVVTNKNPYLFKYQLSKTETAVKETVLLPFINLLGPFPASVAQPQPPQAAGAQAKVTIPLPGCPERSAAEDMLSQILAAKNELAAVRTEVESLAASSKAAKDVLESQVTNDQTGLRSATADCQTLCSHTAQIAADKAFMDFPTQDLAKLGKRLDAAPATSAKLRQQVEIYRTSFTDPACQPQPVPQRLAESVTTADDAESRITADQAALDQGIELAKAVKPWQVAIRAVQANSSAFVERLTVGDFEQTTDVGLKLARQPVDKPDPPAELVSTTLRFGQGPFFTLSGGIAYSDVDKPQFKPTQGFERKRSGELVQPEVSTRVIGTSETATPVSPLVMLNGRLWAWSYASLHLSLGITAKNSDGSTDVEYLVGPSLSFLDDQLFLTVGAYGWRRQSLQGDQYVGQPIPMSVTDLPTSKHTDWKPGFALTYKIR